DGPVLVAGGEGDLSPLASAELYDPATGAWTTTDDMRSTRSGHTATLLGSGQVLVAGGKRARPPGYQSSAELYDPLTGSWTPTGSMQSAHVDHTATLLPDGQVLVAGGWGGFDRLNTMALLTELYDPATGTWTTTGSLVTPRVFHSATLLPDGT